MSSCICFFSLSKLTKIGSNFVESIKFVVYQHKKRSYIVWPWSAMRRMLCKIQFQHKISLQLGHEFENSKWQSACNFISIKSKCSYWETTNQHRHYWIYVFSCFVYLSFIAWIGLLNSSTCQLKLVFNVLDRREKKNMHTHTHLMLLKCNVSILYGLPSSFRIIVPMTWIVWFYSLFAHCCKFTNSYA